MDRDEKDWREEEEGRRNKETKVERGVGEWNGSHERKRKKRRRGICGPETTKP